MFCVELSAGVGSFAKGWFDLFYRLLGVEKFKRLVLKFEKLLRGKKGGRNRNYHPESLTEKGLLNYVWYLRCNTLLHVLSIAALAGYDILLRVLHFHVWPLVLLEIALLIYNGYCILLQRYNFLRLRRLMRARREALEKRFEKYCRSLEENLAKGESAGLSGEVFSAARLSEADLGLLDRVERVFLERESCVIGPSDLESLKHFGELLELAGIKSGEAARGESLQEEAARGESLQKEAACGESARGEASRGESTREDMPDGYLADLWELEPPAWTDELLMTVRNVFDKNARGQKRLVVLRTQDAESERLFRKVFGIGPAETVLLRVRVLRHCHEICK